MNASRAERRWLKWCRYVEKTGTVAGYRPVWSPGPVHTGQAKAWGDYTYARRWAPKGIRDVRIPGWGMR